MVLSKGMSVKLFVPPSSITVTLLQRRSAHTIAAVSPAARLRGSRSHQHQMHQWVRSEIQMRWKKTRSHLRQQLLHHAHPCRKVFHLHKEGIKRLGKRTSGTSSISVSSCSSLGTWRSNTLFFLDSSRGSKVKKDEKELAHKLAAGVNSPNKGPKEVEELDRVAGNVEDEIGERIAAVRESELLYGPHSLLAVFGPLLLHVCGSPYKFKVC
ncbi:hypothetical protein EV363DRAFT_398875 [Boletus edulis]|nr:hypothetical protein EV363DRAFT_398875 [Boletus edulis]